MLLLLRILQLPLVQVRLVLWDLLALCPTPAAAVAADTDAIRAIIQPLGLHNKRAVAVQKLSSDFMHKEVRCGVVVFVGLMFPCVALCCHYITSQLPLQAVAAANMYARRACAQSANVWDCMIMSKSCGCAEVVKWPFAQGGELNLGL